MGEYQRKYYQEHREELIKYRREYRKGLKENPPYKEAGKLLRIRLEILNKSQSWLAEQLGVSREAVSKYLEGIYFPRKENIRENLCRVLKIKRQDLENLVEK